MLTQTAAGRTFDYSHSVGGRDMMKPYGLALGSGNLAFVTDRRNSALAQIRAGGVHSPQVKKIDLGDHAGEEQLLHEFALIGEGPDELTWPAGMACDKDDNLYVADEWLNRISVFDKDGRHLRNWGEVGSGAGQLNRPSGVAFDADEALLVVDSLNHRVQRFSKDGRQLGGWGSRGAGAGMFEAPWGIAIDVDGFVYVVDHGNNRVQKFSADGDFVFEFGGFGSGRGEFNRPSDVAVDPDGDIYVCDWANNRVQAFDPEGEHFMTFTGDAVELAKWQQQFVNTNEAENRARRRVKSLEPEWRFALPMTVRFHDKKGWLMVVDTQRGRFQVYEKLKGYVEPQFNL